jgi:two-component system phosphate regulon sensor histidine kinase PhoR
MNKLKELLDTLLGNDGVKRLTDENEELREREKRVIDYVRRKTNQLLLVMGTLPLRPEELDDRSLLELDPIGIVADSFEQVLENHHITHDRLKMAQEETQAILEAAGTAILVVDEKMRIEHCNLKAVELFSKNMAMEEMIGKPCHKLLCNHEYPPADCTFEAVMASRTPMCRYDWYLEEKKRWFDVSAAPIKDKFGNITRVVLIYNDVTVRKNMEASLRESEAIYRTLFENTTDLIQSVSPDGTFRYVNKAWLENLGYEQGDLDRLNLKDIVHPDSLDHCLEFFQQLMAGKKGGHIDALFLSRDGRGIPVSGNVSCTYSEGKPVATCGIFRRSSDS